MPVVPFPTDATEGKIWPDPVAYPDESRRWICTVVGFNGRRRWKLYGGGGVGGGGSPGTPGTPGSEWRIGDGAPDNAVGIDKDYWVNRLNGDVYKRAGGAYAITGFNMKGPPGAAGGTGGTFQLAPGGAPGSELAPQAGTDWAVLNTNVVAGADYVQFNAAAALAMAQETSAGIKDNTLYNCVLEVFDYVSGGCEVLLYGPTTGHLGISARYTANGTYAFNLTTNGSTGTQLNQIRLRCNGTGTHSFKARLSVKEAGVASAYPERAFDIIEREKPIEITKGGISESNTAAQNYDAWINLIQTFGRRKWVIPEMEFDITALPIYWDGWLEGHGRNYSIINITGTGNVHGCDVRGISTFDRSMQVVLSGFSLVKKGGAQTTAGTGPGQNNWSGLYCRTKCDTNDLTIDGFTNDGFYFAPWDANEATGAGGSIDRAPFFSKHAGLVVKNCGRDGLAVRRGANAHIFTQSQFISNGRYGLNHFTDGFATYSNEFRVGQCSYNGSVGWNFNNGTNTVTSQIYAEQNGCSTPGSNGTAYATTNYDYAIGNNCTDSWFGLGALFGNDETTKQSHIQLPTFNPTRIKILEGARVRFGTWT